MITTLISTAAYASYKNVSLFQRACRPLLSLGHKLNSRFSSFKLYDLVAGHMRRDFHPYIFFPIIDYTLLALFLNYYFRLQSAANGFGNAGRFWIYGVVYVLPFFAALGWESLVRDLSHDRRRKILWGALVGAPLVAAGVFFATGLSFDKPVAGGVGAIGFTALAWFSLAGYGALLAGKLPGGSGRFYFKAMIFLWLLLLARSFPYDLIAQMLSDSRGERNYWMTVWGKGKNLLIYLPGIYLAMRLFDNKLPGLWYGTRFKGVDFKPYLYLLLPIIIMPFIAPLLFDRFTNTYPVIKMNVVNASGLGNPFLLILLFEVVYGLSFFTIELIFRGAFIIGLAQQIAVRSLLPMACIYGLLHIGKPPAEAFFSIFGGYIIGIWALRTGSIIGGWMLHVGLAWSMEVSAALFRILQI